MAFNFFKNKRLGTWFGVNRNGTVVMFATEPIKDIENGIWFSKYPMVNSLIYPIISEIAMKSKLTFDSEIQYMEFNIGK